MGGGAEEVDVEVGVGEGGAGGEAGEKTAERGDTGGEERGGFSGVPKGRVGQAVLDLEGGPAAGKKQADSLEGVGGGAEQAFEAGRAGEMVGKGGGGAGAGHKEESAGFSGSDAFTEGDEGRAEGQELGEGAVWLAGQAEGAGEGVVRAKGEDAERDAGAGEGLGDGMGGAVAAESKDGL